MTTKIPDRIIWAVAQLAVNPSDEILEIGCGTGLAASLICSQLADGNLTAIDRSASQISIARKRNRAHVASGKAAFYAASLAEANFGRKRFHKALAVNVNLFWLQPAAEFEALKKALDSRGKICFVFQPPASSKIRRIAETCSRFLLDHGFSDIEVDTEELQPATAVSIRARVRAA